MPGIDLWLLNILLPQYYVLSQSCITVFAEIFVVVLISDVTFITKFKKLNNWRCTVQHAELARLFRN